MTADDAADPPGAEDATEIGHRPPAAAEIDGSTVIARRESRRRSEREAADPAAPPSAPVPTVSVAGGSAPSAGDADGGVGVPQRVYAPRTSPSSASPNSRAGRTTAAAPTLRRRTRPRPAPVSSARRDARRLALVLVAAASPVVIGVTLLLVLLLPR